MISLCYLIVCVNLLYTFAEDETFLHIKTRKLQEYKETFSESITAANQYEYLARTVTPYWNLTYNEQLDMKQNRCRAIVDTIVERVEGLNHKMKYKLLQIVPSPVTKAYRNRDEFVINIGIDGNPKTVGLLIGKYSLGKTISIPPTKLVTIKESHKRVAQVYEDFIRLSPLPANINLYGGGHWRSIVIRSNEAGDILAAIIVQPNGYTNKTIQDQKHKLKDYFLKHLPNISLFHQQCMFRRCSDKDNPFHLLYGQPYLSETLNSYKFKISPNSFFHVNKLGTEVLYNTVIKTAKLKPNTTLLDVCSGAGTLGMIASKFVKEVIGVEPTLQAVGDAIDAAKINKIDNVKFLGGNPDKNLKIILYRLNTSSEVVLVVNGGYAGIGSDFMRLIRGFPLISKVVYLDTCSSSDNQNTIHSFEILCSNNKVSYPAFTLTKVIPVDLYPQSIEFQLILLFERTPQ